MPVELASSVTRQGAEVYRAVYPEERGCEECYGDECIHIHVLGPLWWVDGQVGHNKYDCKLHYPLNTRKPNVYTVEPRDLSSIGAGLR